MKLTVEAQRTLDRRKEIGESCIALANIGGGEEPETGASDAISDILTALFGPAGTNVPEGDSWTEEYNAGALEEARHLLDHALASYEGDVEDYYSESA